MLIALQCNLFLKFEYNKFVSRSNFQFSSEDLESVSTFEYRKFNKMTSDLSGKVIVVTGAGQGQIDHFIIMFHFFVLNLTFFSYPRIRPFYDDLGIGRDLCERLDALGAIVYAVSRSAEPLLELKSTHPRVKTIQLDVSDWDNTKIQLQKHLNGVKIDGLVNNAAISVSKTVYELTEKDFDKYVSCAESV